MTTSLSFMKVSCCDLRELYLSKNDQNKSLGCLEHFFQKYMRSLNFLSDDLKLHVTSRSRWNQLLKSIE